MGRVIVAISAVLVLLTGCATLQQRPSNVQIAKFTSNKVLRTCEFWFEWTY